MPASNRETLTAGRCIAGAEREGRISGYLLKVLRESIGLTQEGLAEQFGLDATTVQGWESGRRPLMAISMASYFAIRKRLLSLGVHPRLIAQLEPALEADRFLAQVLSTEPHKVPTQEHPLSSWVITRPFTDMTAWPITGAAPTVLSGVRPKAPRRGPVAAGPRLVADERSHFFEHLRSAAERADIDTVDGMLLRRQAHYVASFDDSGETEEWLAEMQRSEERRFLRESDWSPSWAVVRSGAHSLARKGDREALQNFISKGLLGDACETANLNYWAYWLGEIAEPQASDMFMVQISAEAWRGTKLLRHLVSKLESGNFYVDVVVHTLWALLQRRPAVVHDEPGMISELIDRAREALDGGGISCQSRRELEEILYGLRMADGR